MEQGYNTSVRGGYCTAPSRLDEVVEIGKFIATEFGLIVLLAAGVALPLAWLAIARYLAPYTQHTPLAFWSLVLAPLVTMLVIVAFGIYSMVLFVFGFECTCSTWRANGRDLEMSNVELDQFADAFEHRERTVARSILKRKQMYPRAGEAGHRISVWILME